MTASVGLGPYCSASCRLRSNSDRARAYSLARERDEAEHDQRRLLAAMIPGGGEERQRRLRVFARPFEVSLCPGEPGGPLERLGAERRIAPAIPLERRLEPRAAFVEVAVHPPEAPDAAHQPEQPLGLACVPAPGERGAQIPALWLERCHPLLQRRQLGRLRSLDEAEHVLRQPPLRPGLLALVADPLARVLAHRLQQPVARDTVVLLGNDERGVDQAADQFERALRVAVEADRGRRLEREAAAEDREPRQQRLLLWGEQLVAPVHRLAQRLVARGRQPPPGDEEAEPVGKPRLDLRE